VKGGGFALPLRDGVSWSGVRHAQHPGFLLPTSRERVLKRGGEQFYGARAISVVATVTANTDRRLAMHAAGRRRSAYRGLSADMVDPCSITDSAISNPPLPSRSSAVRFALVAHAPVLTLAISPDSLWAARLSPMFSLAKTLTHADAPMGVKSSPAPAKSACADHVNWTPPADAGSSPAPPSPPPPSCDCMLALQPRRH
jgi:hypothetical protein